MRNGIVVGSAAVITLAIVCLGQEAPPSKLREVFNRGPHQALDAIGPFAGGTRRVALPEGRERDADETDNGASPPPDVLPPAVPMHAGASFLEALRTMPQLISNIMNLPVSESLIGLKGPGTGPGAGSDRSVALTTFWPKGSVFNSNSGDPQIASSHWAVGTLTWDTLAFFDKSGKLLQQTADFPNPTNTETIFAPVVAYLDANFLNLSPQYAGNPDFTFANGQVGDARLEFDSFHDRWVVLATAKNNGQPKGVYSDFAIRSQRRTKLLLAISKDEDPSHGFLVYAFNASPDDGACNKLTDNSPCPGSAFTPGDASDYPSIGFTSSHYLMTIGTVHEDLGDPAKTNFRGVLVVGNALDLTSGKSHPRMTEFWSFDLGNGDVAQGPTMPVVSRQVVLNGDHGFVVTTDIDASGNGSLCVVAVTPSEPPELSAVAIPMPGLALSNDWPQRGISSVKVTTANISNIPIKATQINGILTAAWEDSRNWGSSNGPSSPSIHLITARVNTFPNVILERDRVFGGRNGLDDPANESAGYGMPGVTMNKDGDIAVVYNRNSTDLYVEARYSTWLHNEPDIRPSRILQAGEAAIQCSSPCQPPLHFDTGGAALDPYDQTGIWMAHMYAIGGSDSLAVGKVFGLTYPGLLPGNIGLQILCGPFCSEPFPGSTTPGGQFDLLYTVWNHGDGAAHTPFAEISLVPVAAPGPVLLGTDSLPDLNPGQSVDRSFHVTVPPGTPSGIYRLRIIANLQGNSHQYTQGINFADAGQEVQVLVR